MTEAAARSLADFIDSHGLPGDASRTDPPFAATLERFPRLGSIFETTRELRFLLGPWRWLIIVYAYRVDNELVAVLAFEDGRSARSARRQTLIQLDDARLAALDERAAASQPHSCRRYVRPVRPS